MDKEKLIDPGQLSYEQARDELVPVSYTHLRAHETN